MLISKYSIVNYFLRRLSDVYIITLNASAAFDKANKNTYVLLSKLIDSNIPFKVIWEGLLLNW